MKPTPIQVIVDWMTEFQFDSLDHAEKTLWRTSKGAFSQGVLAFAALNTFLRTFFELFTEGFHPATAFVAAMSLVGGVIFTFTGIRHAERNKAAGQYIKLAVAQQNFNQGRKFGEGRDQ